MTNEQKERITAMRHDGYGYTTIAKAVGLTKDNVKAYCRAHDLAGVSDGVHADGPADLADLPAPGDESAVRRRDGDAGRRALLRAAVPADAGQLRRSK